MVNKQRPSLAPINQQRGVVLVVSLIMLLLIAILAMSGMRATTMEERMASNSRNTNIAFQMAETALRQAETMIEDEAKAKSIPDAEARTVFNPTPGTTSFGNCFIINGSEDFSLQARWEAAACDYVGTADDALSNPPQFFIEFIYKEPLLDAAVNVPRPCIYQITARGYGADKNSHVTLQSTYKFSSCM